MSTGKKIVKSKITNDVSPSTNSQEKKTEKRQRNDPFEMVDDDNMSKPISHYQASKKKIKVCPDAEVDEIMSGLIGHYQPSLKTTNIGSDSEDAEVRKKIFELFGKHHKTRKQYNESLFKNFSEVMSQVNADHEAMKENDQKLEQLTGSFMKSMRQATLAFKEKVKALNEIQSFEKLFQDMESNHMKEQKNLMDKLDNDIKKLRDKLDKESKRKAWEQMRRKISNAMQNDD